MARLPGDDLGDGDAFVLGLVSEHRTNNNVADGIRRFQCWCHSPGQ